MCSVDSRTQLSYEWSGPNINVQSGPELHVDEQEESRDSVYTCTVTNQFNSKSTDFTLKDCHTGLSFNTAVLDALRLRCSFTFTLCLLCAGKAGSTALLPAIIVPLLLLLLLIPLAFFLYRRYRSKEQKRKCHEKVFNTKHSHPQNTSLIESCVSQRFYYKD